MSGPKSRRRLAPWGNPLIERIITSGSRRNRHQVVRGAYLAVLALTAVVAILFTTSVGGRVSMRGLAVAGSSVFEIVVLLQVLGICLLTPVFMAGAIEQEASPRTWDILLTTPLSSTGIVLGNLLGRLFFVLALIIATLPVLVVLQAFGGVGPRMVFMAAGIAGCTALAVASAAVTLSATRTGGRRAVLAFFAGVIVVLVATWVLDQILQPASAMDHHTTWATPLNPFLAVLTVLRPGDIIAVAPPGSGGFARFWLESPVMAFVAMTAVLSGVMVCWAILRVRVLGPVIGRGGSAQAVPRRHRPVGRNAISWRASVGRPRRGLDNVLRWSWAAIGSLGGIVFVAMACAGVIPAGPASTILVAMLMAEMLIVALASVTIAGSAIASERESGTLDLLLTTPIQPRPYLVGKVHGIVRGLLPLLIVPLVTAIAAAVVPLAPGLGEGIDWLPGAAIAAALTLVPFVAFCVAVGLHWSLRSRGTTGAVTISSVLCLAVAGILGICIVPMGESFPLGGAVMAGLTPFTAVDALTAGTRWSALGPGDTLDGMSWRLVAGGVVGGLGWSAFAWMVLVTTQRSFTVTMRRMAGTN